MVSSDQEIFAPVYVSEPSEPLFIQNSFTEAQAPIGTPKKKSVQFDSYRPGAMLAESAFVGHGSPAFSSDTMLTPASFSDKESESDASTTDTAHEAMQLASADGAGYMMPNLAMMADSSWHLSQSYAGAGYWPMPYPLPFQAQPEQMWPQQKPRERAETWSQDNPSEGSSGHRLGRCKPCAFMYKDGCRSGADCPYCHLCPPGEKQRRKRVMRSMQRNLTE